MPWRLNKDESIGQNPYATQTKVIRRIKCHGTEQKLMSMRCNRRRIPQGGMMSVDMMMSFEESSRLVRIRVKSYDDDECSLAQIW